MQGRAIAAAFAAAALGALAQVPEGYPADYAHIVADYVVKPIPVSAQITEFLDAKKRLEFLAQWKDAVAGGAK